MGTKRTNVIAGYMYITIKIWRIKLFNIVMLYHHCIPNKYNLYVVVPWF